MNDPHVKSMRYRVEACPGVDYKDPPALDVRADAFEGHLAEGVLSCHLREHYSRVAEAQKAMGEFLRAWKIHVALQMGRPEIQFTYMDAEVIDRDPPPPGAPQVVRPDPMDAVLLLEKVSAHITRGEYPPPPFRFRLTPDAETLWNRYSGYVGGREPLPAMAYFCVTAFEWSAGGRTAAPKQYSVSRTVLKKLRELSSTRGDSTTARKVRGAEALQPLSGREERWIQTVVKLLIRRLGEYEPGLALPTITMKDLPPL
jgi:hypothetical protein